MATLRTSQIQSQKQKISQTMRSWLPLLQASLDNLNEALEPFKESNPLLDIKQGHERVQESKFAKKNFFTQVTQNSVTEQIEALSIGKKTLYENLFEQINPPLFPTPKSQKIAYKIIEYINNEGYFEYEDEILDELDCSLNELEKVRLRFAYLEPVGVGANDFKEAFLFQLENTQIDEKSYKLAKELIEDFSNIQDYSKKTNFAKAISIIKHFKLPPAIDYLETSAPIIPDIFIYEDGDGIKISLNDSYYPEISIDTEGLDEKQEFIASKIKEGKELIEALELRKATLYKIGLNIIENQYDFFKNGTLKPMRLKDLAVIMDRNPSTISRAISGKYLACDRGIFALKDFFTTALDDDVSNSSIKDYIEQTIAYENHQKPLSDAKLLKMIENKFNIQLSRRTITKYRKQLNIGSSSQRKKLYILQH